MFDRAKRSPLQTPLRVLMRERARRSRAACRALAPQAWTRRDMTALRVLGWVFLSVGTFGVGSAAFVDTTGRSGQDFVVVLAAVSLLLAGGTWILVLTGRQARERAVSAE